MWNNLIKLISATNWIQWISISMVLAGGLLQVSKIFIDKRITYLKNSLNIEKEERYNDEIIELKNYDIKIRMININLKYMKL